ncbi:hypothetical protein LJB42_000782 [Komagataella kurtzmanii]|nr:hypothetical protein LJB42_000782 [Komagataella kurtzmanii]
MTFPDSNVTNFISKRARARGIDPAFNSVGFGKAHDKGVAPINLGYGMPDQSFFPIKSLQVNLQDSSFEVPRETANRQEIDLKTGLQYASPYGHPSLLKYTREIIERIHSPANDRWDTVITAGGANGIDKCFDLLLDEGDTVLIEEYTFVPILGSVKNIGATVVPLKFDFQSQSGLDIEYLAYVLENWESLYPGKRFPKVLYTIPNGQNPTGFVTDLKSKQKIYDICVQNDIFIIEDDPYGYLELATDKPFDDVEEYLKSLPTSYLSVDKHSRVLRIESFSKVFAPGSRLGFIVAHKDFIEPITNYSVLATGFPSGPSQILINNTITALGGLDGWFKWAIKVRNEYWSRKQAAMKQLLQSSCAKKDQLIVFEPRAGMFISVSLNFPPGSSCLELMSKLSEKTAQHGVTVVPYQTLSPIPDFTKDNCHYVRLTIASAIDHGQLKEAFRRFTSAVEDLFQDLESS